MAWATAVGKEQMAATAVVRHILILNKKMNFYYLSSGSSALWTWLLLCWRCTRKTHLKLLDCKHLGFKVVRVFFLVKIVWGWLLLSFPGWPSCLGKVADIVRRSWRHLSDWSLVVDAKLCYTGGTMCHDMAREEKRGERPQGTTGDWGWGRAMGGDQ